MIFKCVVGIVNIGDVVGYVGCKILICFIEYEYYVFCYVFVVMVVNFFDNCDCFGVLNGKLFVGDIFKMGFVGNCVI